MYIRWRIRYNRKKYGSYTPSSSHLSYDDVDSYGVVESMSELG